MRSNYPSVFGPTLKVVYFSWMNQNFLNFHFGLLFLSVCTSDSYICVCIWLYPCVLQSESWLSNVDFSNAKERRLTNPFLISENTDFVCSGSKIYFLAKTSLICLTEGLAPSATAYQMIRSESIKIIVKILLAAVSKMLTALLYF